MKRSHFIPCECTGHLLEITTLGEYRGRESVPADNDSYLIYWTQDVARPLKDAWRALRGVRLEHDIIVTRDDLVALRDHLNDMLGD